MSNEIQNMLTLLANRQDLTREQAMHAFQIIMNGGATPGQIAAFLMGLRQKGETVDEITAGAMALRAKMTKLQAPEDAVDTCGTGGDAKGLLNVSTAVSLVVAACGVPVAKHGNRAISSTSGSSDVLTALGVNINAEIPLLEQMLRECHFCFMMAPRFHPAMRHVAPVRIELGLRTIFNLLGPLSNPATPSRQLLGVYAPHLVEPMAKVLRELGLKRAWVVHGHDGLDELSIATSSYICELKDGEIRSFEISPEDAGLARAELDAIKGHDPQFNADHLTRLLGGAQGVYRDIVLLNAAAVLLIADRVSDLKEGCEMAAEAIDSSKARENLAKLVRMSNVAAV